MIKQITRAVFKSYYKSVEKFMNDPMGTQAQNFAYLIEHGRNTLFGAENQFDNIKSIADFRQKVPVASYENLRPYLDKIIIGDIMLMIPGISLTNSVRDMLLGDTLSGTMRLVESLLWAGAQAAGFMAAIWLMGYLFV